MFEYRFYNSPNDTRPITITHDDCEFFRILGWSDATKESRDLSRKIVSVRNPASIFKTGMDITFNNDDGSQETIHYNFLFAGAGDTRKQRALFATDEVRHKIIPYIMNGLTMDNVNTPKGGKYICSGLRFTTYESLWFTGSRRTEFNIDKCIVIKDLENTVYYNALIVDAPKNYVSETVQPVHKDMEITDGAGMFLPGTFQDPDTGDDLKAFTARAPWLKGLLVSHDFRAAALRTGNYIVKDAWGQDHDIIAEDINCIWTTSQLKLWKAYKSWDHYKRAYKDIKQHFCVALTPEEKSKLILSYQPLQSLCATHGEIEELMADSIETIWDKSGKSSNGDTVNYKNTLRALGLDKMPVFQQLTEPMLNLKYCITRIRDYIENEIDKLSCGEIKLKGYEPFVSPDWNWVCNQLFGDDMPEVPIGFVCCPLFKYGMECDIIRYPHLHPSSHCIRTNTEIEGLDAPVVYADHDGITMIAVEADADGDHLQLFIDQRFVNIVKRPENHVPPLYYECSSGKKYPVIFDFTPEDELTYDDDGNCIHKHYLFDELRDSYGDKANVGIPSNWATRILNSNLDHAAKLRYVALLAHNIQARIDYPKAGVSYDVPQYIVDEIRQYELPAFMRLKKENEDLDRINTKNRGILNECRIEVLGLGNFNPTDEEKDLIKAMYKNRRANIRTFQKKHYKPARTEETASAVMDYIMLESEKLRKQINMKDWFIKGKQMFQLNEPRYYNTKEDRDKAKENDKAFRKKYAKFIYDCQSKQLHPIYWERINMMTMVNPDPDIQRETDKRFREQFHCGDKEIRKLFAFALQNNMFLSFVLYVWPNEFLAWALTQKKAEAIPLKERNNFIADGAKHGAVGGKKGDRQRKAEGGKNGSPAKHGKVVHADTGEVLYEGSYQECEAFIGCAKDNFSKKAKSGEALKSKKLGHKVLCIPEARETVE